MDKRILKTMLTFVIASMIGLIMPIIGQWYEQQTGLLPFGLYIIGGIGCLVTIILTIAKIWGELK
jgi:hypothetical protein